MTNEAQCIETPTWFVRRTIADASATPIGTLMKLTTPNTVANSTADNDVFGGIAWEEKTANDGLTEIVVAMNGVWDIHCTAVAITAGAIVNIGGADNDVSSAAAADLLTGSVVGKSEEAGNNTLMRTRVGTLV